MLQTVSRFAWRAAPLTLQGKRAVKDFCFRWFPSLFRSLPAYQRWRLFQNDMQESVSSGRPSAHRASLPAVPAISSADAETVRAIAMFLPQFHRIPENDRWWGEGFTEWTNVRRARSMYGGHYQPNVPHKDVGYYDLTENGVLERQARMAREHGIHGFCFYHYWFSGRRLLEQPLEQMLRSGRPDFPYCICWANENWTRSWDGSDESVLISSRDEVDDDRLFIRDLLPFLRDPRYIRVDGRPLVLVYRVGSLRNPGRTADTWRRICRREGVGDIHLCSVWSFDIRDPRKDGFDSALQFPPLMIAGENLAERRDVVGIPVPGFKGAILDYRDAVRAGLRDFPGEFPVYRGVMPAWDNTPRRMERGTSWIHASPELYGRWLRGAVARTVAERSQDQRLVFINAWNEWAEGAYLEPDQRYGYRRLDETKAALSGAPADDASGAGIDIPRAGGGLSGSLDRRVASRETVTSPDFEARLAESRRNVLVDLLFCQPGFHGGGEYGKAVFHALVRHASQADGLRVWAAFDPAVSMEPWVWRLCEAAKVPIVPVTTPANIAALVDAGRFDAFFTPGLVSYIDEFHGRGRDDVRPDRDRRTSIVGVVHDILEVSLEGRGLSGRGDVKAGRGYRREDYRRLFSNAGIDHIVTVSEFSRREILAAFGPLAATLVVRMPPMKRRVAPEAFAIGGKPVAALDFGLIVDAGRPEKNAATAVRAFDGLFSMPAVADFADFRVVVSGIDTLADLGVGRLRHAERFLTVPHLPPEHFEFLLERARFLVYPSFTEGFGYPPVEAMLYGTPSIVSRAGALTEVGGDAVMFCDPYDVDSVQDAILAMRRDPLPRALISKRLAALSAMQRNDIAALIELVCTAGRDDSSGRMMEAVKHGSPLERASARDSKASAVREA